MKDQTHKNIWTGFEKEKILLIKLANTRVETKILVLHFLHSGGGGTTNLVLHENNTPLI